MKINVFLFYLLYMCPQLINEIQLRSVALFNKLFTEAKKLCHNAQSYYILLKFEITYHFLPALCLYWVRWYGLNTSAFSENSEMHIDQL